jgi:sugar phosphate isomerase/epimerase
MTTQDAIAHAANIGCGGIEIVAEQHLAGWPNPKYADMIKMKDHIESLGMELAAFSCYLPTRIRPDRKQTMAEIKESATQEIIQASIMGAKICRPFYISASEGAENKSEQIRRGQQELIEIIVDTLPVLEKYNVIWGVEIHAPHPPTYYNQVIERVNSPYVRLIPDFSCWQSKGAPSQFTNNPLITFVNLIPKSCHFHGKAHVFDSNGEEPNTPYRELLGALKDANFEGYVVAENEGWFLGYADSRKTVETHINLLKRYAY